MGPLDFLLSKFGGQQQPMGGVLGQVAKMQPEQGFAAPRMDMPQQKPKFWQTPEFASTLTRLGANLAAASSNNEDFLTGLSLATAQTAKDTEAARQQSMQNQLIQAQINKANAEAAPQLPFSGTGFENQVAGTYYNAYLAQGLSPMEAQIKAAQAVFNREPTYIQQGENLIPIPGRTLPSIPGMAPTAAPMAALTAAPRQFDAIDQTAQALGVTPTPVGMLPPPSGTGTPDMSLFQQPATAPARPTLQAPTIGVPQIPGAGGITTQALREEAGKATIGLQGKQAEQAMAKTAELGGDINEAYNAIQSLGTLLDASGSMFNQQGLAPETKSMIANRLGVNDPSIRRQAAATAQVGAARAESLGPLLKPLVGAGVVTEGERANAMKVVSDPNSNPDQIYAVVAPLMEKSRNRLRIMEIERANLQQDIKESRADIAQRLGVDINTGLAVGKTSQDFLPQTQGVPSGVDPNVWQYLTPEERRLWQQ